MMVLVLILAGVGLANAIVNEYIFEWLHKILPRWKWIQSLFDCTTCLSFHTGWILGLVFGYSWWCIPMGLTASLIAREITLWEEKE